MSRIFVGMSGGVDSSVAASLLCEQGHDVVGVYLKSWDGLPTPTGVKFRDQCQWKEERRDAMRVAAHLKIPFLTYDFTEEYRQGVIEYFFSEYEAGRTPNPDVMCNKEIKFKAFLDRARAEGADAVATGHYAQVGQGADGKYVLRQGMDTSKDQSYFLWTLTQEQLQYSLFPIGHLQKIEVRALAEKAGLSTAEKPDSQGICFVGKVAVEDFLKARLPEQSGAIITSTGEHVGEHQGLPFYTIGQRHGIKISGAQPYYVAEKRADTNTLVVAIGDADEILYRDRLTGDHLSWVNEPPKVGQKLGAKIRYRQPTQEMEISELINESCELKFTKPQRAITPGQSVVLYDGDRLVGGGVIR